MLTKTLSSLLMVAAASILFLTGCSKPTDKPAEPAPIRLEIPPAGQLPFGVTPMAYRLDLVTDPASDTFSGTVEIDLQFDAPHARIWLHSLDHDIESATIRLPDDTEIIATFSRSEAEGGVSSLDFASPVPAGNATLIVAYNAPYNHNLAGLYKATQKNRPYLATQMEPIDARRMVPSFDEPRFKTPWTLTITTPQGNQVIANGALKSTTTLDNGMVRHQFATTRKIQSYLLALAVGPYDLREGGVLPPNSVRPEGVPFRGFAAAGKGDQLAQAMAITQQMVSWQEAYFDYPYPYGKLDLIAVPDFAYGAMENAGAIIYREGALLMNERTSFARKRGILTTHAHELGHQWFGNLVTPKWWDDIWLNEAFATWISLKTMDAVYPDAGFDLAPQRAAIGVMGADSLINARQIRNPITRNADIMDAFDGITYRKGGGVLSMFETYLGEDQFRAGIRLHMRRFEDGVADVDDFMTSLAEGSGDPGVVDSFKTFILQPGIPYLKVDLTCPSPDAGTITVTQSRYAPLGSEIDTQASIWAVPFAVRLSSAGEDRIIRQMLTEKTTEIAVTNGCPDWIIPNAGGTGYWRFSLSEAGWQSLLSAYDSLSAGEQLVFADSATAAFAAGEMPATVLLEALSANANGDWGAASDPLGNLQAYMDAVPDQAGKDAMRDFVMAAYGARYDDLSSRPASALSQGETLLKNSLHSSLLDLGRIDEDRIRLAVAAAAYVGVDGAPDPAALNPSDVASAIAVAAEDASDSRFYAAALAFAKASDNQRERRSILSNLAANVSQTDMLDLMKTVQTDAFKGQEAWSVALAALRNRNAQDAAWSQFKTDFDAITERTPQVRKAQTVSAISSFCDTAAIDEAIAFFEAKANAMPGLERRLAQSAETARLCAAFRAEKGAELSQALKNR